MKLSNPIIYDASDESLGMVYRVLHFYYMVIFEGGNRNSYYCGITDDVERRKGEHERDDHQGKAITQMIACKCSSKEASEKIEMMMHEDGFDIGNTQTLGNGANECSVYVYLYKKP